MANTRFSQCLLTLKRNKNPNLQKHAQPFPLGGKEVAQTLREVKDKKQKALALIEKPEAKNEKAPTHTERPITIQLLQRRKRRRRKQKNGKITKIEEKLLKTKYGDKGPALFGSMKQLDISSQFVGKES